MTRSKTVPQKKLLSADDILNAEDLITVDVEVPEWGGTVRLRSLSGDQVAKFIELTQDSTQRDSSTRILVMSAIDEEGKQLFTEEQIKTLQKKSFRAVIRLQEKALEINGMSPEAEVKVKNV